MDRVELKVERHLTEQLEYIEKALETTNVYLEARPGLGKTYLINELAKTHNILLVSPMCSTRDGSTSNLGNLKVLETKDLAVTKKLSPCTSYAVIWDTFALMIERNLLSCFDLVVLDESHKIVQHASFRESGYVVAEWLAKTNTRYMMMTGTPMGESELFFGLEYIKITAKEHRELTLSIINCNGRPLVEDALLAFAKKCALDKRKTIFFSNSNRAMQDRVIAKLVRDHKIGFYSSMMSDKDLEEFINKKETFSDYDLVCATEYLAEGVNIKLKDDETSAILVTDEREMSPMLLMQIANRFRDTDIHIYYVHNTKLDNKTREKTLIEKAKEEIKSNSGVSLAGLSEWLLGDVASIVRDKSLVQVGNNEYAVDCLRKSIQELLDLTKKMTSIGFFKEYFKAKDYDVQMIEWKKNKVRALHKEYDVVQFISKNIREVLNVLSTISLEKKIYTKDVIQEDRLGKTRIENGVIKTQNLNLFNSIIKKVKKLNKDGVFLTNIANILNAPQRYGKIDSWYSTLDVLSRWSEDYEEPLKHIKESTAKALVKAKAMEELEKYRDKFPHTVEAIVEKETSKMHEVYVLAQKLEVSPQDLVDMLNNMKNPNNLIYSEEFTMYKDLNDMLIQKNKTHKDEVSQIRKNISADSNNRNKKACKLYKNGELFKEFESKRAAIAHLGVNKSKFIKTDTIKIDGNEYKIVVSV